MQKDWIHFLAEDLVKNIIQYYLDYGDKKCIADVAEHIRKELRTKTLLQLANTLVKSSQ